MATREGDPADLATRSVMKIVKAPESMTSKERVMAAFAHSKVDRVPIDYLCNSGIDARLKSALGIGADDHESLRQALGVDFRGTGPWFAGPKRFADILGRHIDPVYGIRTCWIEHESGGYWDFCDFPLRDASQEEVDAWPLASADDFDYSTLEGQVRRYEGYALYYGDAGLGDIINSTGMLRTMEQVLVDLITDDPAGLRLIDRKIDLQLEVMRRSLERIGGRIDFVWMGEDLGTQIAPLVSVDLFRRHIRPRHQKIIDLAHSFGLPVMTHTCGSSSWAYEDFIEMGVSAVDTLQPEAHDMSPQYLKERFGSRLMLHGCISTAGPVAYGTVEDVRRDVSEKLEILMPGGGYCLSPTHQLQDNSPVENVIAMYQTAHDLGR
ncbi:MAG: uroporphyrinogen decarboxylase family protein [Fimbriimonas sp.]|nr:uroporphyrinogen decarboxylase family protein [Fimbriimonas sp.]